MAPLFLSIGAALSSVPGITSDFHPTTAQKRRAQQTGHQLQEKLDFEISWREVNVQAAAY